MKKLTKKSLDELAMVMPVISETKLRNYFGGAFYYNESGGFLGETNDGRNSILIGSSINDPKAKLFSAVDPEIVCNVLTTMGKSIGIDGEVTYYEDDENMNKQGSITNDGQIAINYSSRLFGAGKNDYYSFLSVLNHEHFHQILKKRGVSNSKLEEYLALKYEMSQPSFENTSPSYKKDLYRTLFTLVKEEFGFDIDVDAIDNNSENTGSGNYESGDSGSGSYSLSGSDIGISDWEDYLSGIFDYVEHDYSGIYDSGYLA